MQDVKVASKHEPAFRCGYCHERVDPELQAPCGGCGTMIHPECRVQHGGCPTFGCAQAAPAARTAQQQTAAAQPAPAQLGPTMASVGAWGSLVCGGGGMALSFLGLASQLQAMVIAGAAGFVAGAILVAAGVLGLAVLSWRTRSQQPSALTGVTPRAAAALLSRGAFLCGAVGMFLSFLALLSPHMNELVAGGAGFVAGAVLLLAGIVGLALETHGGHAPDRSPSGS